MTEVTGDKIDKILSVLNHQGEDLTRLLRIYKANIVDGINDCITDIRASESGWSDPMATAFYERVDTLKTGIVQKLNDSIQVGGTADKLEELIEQLEDVCYRCRHLTDYERPDDTSSATANPFVDTLKDDKVLIAELLEKISTLRFDSDVSEYNVTIEIPEPEKKTVTVNQGDLVKVKTEDGIKEMYYLGTDSKGRSYFSESWDDSATAYVCTWPGQMGTTDADVNHWGENVTSYVEYQAMAESYALFVLTGGNTGTLTKGNVLQKICGSYANAQYVGDANFNNSIVFENSYYAPEVVKTGGNSYDAANAYHVLNLNDNEKVSFSSVANREVVLSSDYHPDIVLSPGDTLDPSYTELLFITTNCTIGSNTESVILHYDEDEEKYYVVNNETGGYHTAVRENDATDYGFRSITINKLYEVLRLRSGGGGHGGGGSHGF